MAPWSLPLDGIRLGSDCLRVEVAADDLAQYGPDQIVTISDGLIDRNLALARDDCNLIVRPRTPLSATTRYRSSRFRKCHP